jgi:hypothetical protein
MSKREQTVRDMVKANDVTMMRSYLEVDVAEWFSENQIPFAYEAFVIPSVVGPGKEQWEDTVEAIQSVGRGERDQVQLPDGSTMDAFDILTMWNDIYEKHKLADENVVIDPNPALAGFDKQLMMPDFAIYKDADITNADEDFDWSEFDYLVEVSGLYGVGLPEESDDSDWWDWYRLSAVAFKEFMYKMLGLWERTLWVIPNQGSQGGSGNAIPPSLRNDDHYIIMDTTQLGIQLQTLGERLGITEVKEGPGLSPGIQPTKYKRPMTSSGEYERGQITPVMYEHSGIDPSAIDNNKNATIAGQDFILYHGNLGEVYIDDEQVMVRESQWRGMNMILLREYVLDALVRLEDDGIVEDVSRVE